VPPYKKTTQGMDKENQTKKKGKPHKLFGTSPVTLREPMQISPSGNLCALVD